MDIWWVEKEPVGNARLYTHATAQRSKASTLCFVTPRVFIRDMEPAKLRKTNLRALKPRIQLATFSKFPLDHNFIINQKPASEERRVMVPRRA
uniref:Uncharacterized protein n=1 Tax=Siphoviridae sp. ct1SN28 TaxID=2825308 RepID=A0A8S5TRI1_9CAUD|nr:MAG TPA: hypothetical protein [Siphoviridae sp. ct1SN28]